MEELVGVLTDDEDLLELIDMVERRRRRKIFRQRENHFQKWRDNEFVRRFRFSKDGVQFLLNQVAPLIESQTAR